MCIMHEHKELDVTLFQEYGALLEFEDCVQDIAIAGQKPNL